MRKPSKCLVSCEVLVLYFSYYFFSVIEQLGGKHLVMQHLTHEDPNVRYESLIAVQKLMVHNWSVPPPSHTYMYITYPKPNHFDPLMSSVKTL